MVVDLHWNSAAAIVLIAAACAGCNSRGDNHISSRVDSLPTHHETAQPAPAKSRWRDELSVDSAANSPRAIRDGDTTRVLIPASFAHAIDSVVPGFRPFRRRDFTRAVHEFAEADSASGELIPLFAVVADFDGNKQPDVALYGTQAGNTVLLAVLAESAGPRVVVIFSTPTGPPDTAEGSEQFLQIRHAGTADLPDFDAPAKGSDLQHRPLKLANPGFDLTYLGKGGTLYYYDGHRFRSVTSSD